MPGIVEYKETVDYTWVIARALDRVLESYAAVSYDTPGPGIRKLLMAVRALYAAVRPLVAPEIGGRLAEADRLVRSGRHRQALQAIDDIIHDILEELDRRGLLIRSKRLMGVVEE